MNSQLLVQATQRLLQRTDPAVRSAAIDAAILARLQAAPTCMDALQLACTAYAARPCLGTQTYAQVWQQVAQTASGWQHAGLCRGASVGILGFASGPWVVADLACLYAGAVSVPLQSSADAADLQHIAMQTNMQWLVCSPSQLRLAAHLAQACGSIRGLVIIDSDSDSNAPPTVLPPGVTLCTLGALQESAPSTPMPFVRAADDDLVTLMYTSGSTGMPKGAMFTERAWRSEMGIGHDGIFPNVPTLLFNYLPLSHIMGRGSVLHTLMRGGCITFIHNADMSTLMAELGAARPTALALVPRVSMQIYQHYQTLWQARGGAALQDAAARAALENTLFAELRHSVLGDRLAYIFVGSAPTPAHVVDFLQRCFLVPVLNYYGCTEAGPVTFDNQVISALVSHFELADVPELGYRHTDKPYPRGALRVKSRRMISGYYKNAEATAALIDADGWLCMGDIVEQRGPQELHYIDRQNSVLKLAHGEYVPITRLEGLYNSLCPSVAQLFLYGNSMRAYLLAVAVPTPHARLDWGPDLAAQLLKEMRQAAAQSSLRGHEVPRDCLVELQPFSVANGLLTESNKPARARLKAAYGARLEALYTQAAALQQDDLRGLHQAALPVEEKARRILASVLGLPELDAAHLQSSVAQLGGDSLHAARFCSLLQELGGVRLSVSRVLDPALSVAALLQTLAPLASQEGAWDWLKEPPQGVLKATELRVERVLPGGHLPGPASVAEQARCVLLTGASGFLGRFLMLELLQQLPHANGQVICVVRAADDSSARQRVLEPLRRTPALWQRLQALEAERRLTVFAGDMARPQLGLGNAAYTRVCNEVDTVLHNAALVNHALPFASLVEPNILGCAELMQVALRGQRKAFNYLSTVGYTGARAQPVRETARAADLWPERPVKEGYAAGYVSSKWACEVLLEDLHQRTQVPVNLFRPSMILPSTAGLGQINLPDIFSRFLMTLVHTGMAPHSWYAPGQAEFYDGTSVDWVARSIVAVARGVRHGCQRFHVVRPVDGAAVGLDAFTAWVRDAGYPVEPVPVYSAWYTRCMDALQAMEPSVRRASLYPLLPYWQQPLPADNRADSRDFAATLDHLHAPPRPPPLDADYLQHCLQHLVALGCIPPPR